MFLIGVRDQSVEGMTLMARADSLGPSSVSTPYRQSYSLQFRAWRLLHCQAEHHSVTSLRAVTGKFSLSLVEEGKIGRGRAHRVLTVAVRLLELLWMRFVYTS